MFWCLDIEIDIEGDIVVVNKAMNASIGESAGIDLKVQDPDTATIDIELSTKIKKKRRRRSNIGRFPSRGGLKVQKQDTSCKTSQCQCPRIRESSKAVIEEKVANDEEVDSCDVSFTSSYCEETEMDYQEALKSPFNNKRLIISDATRVVVRVGDESYSDVGNLYLFVDGRTMKVKIRIGNEVDEDEVPISKLFFSSKSASSSPISTLTNSDEKSIKLQEKLKHQQQKNNILSKQLKVTNEETNKLKMQNEEKDLLLMASWERNNLLEQRLVNERKRDNNHKVIQKNNDKLKKENMSLKLKDVENHSLISKITDEKKDLNQKIKKINKEKNIHKNNYTSLEYANSKECERRDGVVKRLAEDKKELSNKISTLKNNVATLNKINKKQKNSCSMLKEKKNMAKKEVRRSQKKLDQLQQVITKKNKIICNNKNELKKYNDMIDEYESNNNSILIGKSRNPHGRKNSTTETWPIPIMRVIIEMLINGSSPSSIAPNLKTFVEVLCPNIDIKELPSLRYIRNLRGVVRIIGEALAAFRLGRVEKWEQLFWDGTSRRQTAITTMVASILEDDEIRPIILTCSHIAEGETAEQTLDSIIKIIEKGRVWLKRWIDVCTELFPEEDHCLPDPDKLKITNLKQGGLTTDTCAQARATRKLVVEKMVELLNNWEMSDDNNIGKLYFIYCINVSTNIFLDPTADEIVALEIDCWHHLRNVWFNGMNKEVTKYVKGALKFDLNEIDRRLRVTTNIEGLIRAVGKYFGLCKNYAKGNGDHFQAWMERNYPDDLLMHVREPRGARQDVCVESAGAIYWNRPFYVEFLMMRLKSAEKSNILEENLYLLLTCSEMVASCRVMSIVHISLCIPMRWLAGNSHLMGKYDWNVRSMGRTIDILEEALVKIEEDNELIIQEDYMMNIFKSLMEELPPLEEYINHMFEKKQQKVVSGFNSSGRKLKEIPFSVLRDELFFPKLDTNHNTNNFMEELAKIVAQSILQELRDTKKATHEHLSSVGGRFSWEVSSEKEKELAVGKRATNDLSESAFGSLTEEVSTFSRIGLANAGGMALIRRNGDFSYGNGNDKGMKLFKYKLFLLTFY